MSTDPDSLGFGKRKSKPTAVFGESATSPKGSQSKKKKNNDVPELSANPKKKSGNSGNGGKQRGKNAPKKKGRKTSIPTSESSSSSGNESEGEKGKKKDSLIPKPPIPPEQDKSVDRKNRQDGIHKSIIHTE